MGDGQERQKARFTFGVLTQAFSPSFLSAGKYVGNRPIKLRKSQWKDRNVEIIRGARAPRGPHDPEAQTRKERAKPYKVKKLNNAGK